MTPGRSVACALAAPALLSGCFSFDRDAPDRMRYLLEASRPTSAARDGAGVIEVRPFHADAACAGRQLVYRHADGRVEVPYYDELLITVPVAITEATRRWLDASGRFRAVLAPGSRAAADLVLEGDVLAVHAETGEHPAAVVAITFTLLAPDRSVAWREALSAREGLADESPAAFVRAAGLALAAVLAQLEARLPPVAASPGPRASLRGGG